MFAGCFEVDQCSNSIAKFLYTQLNTVYVFIRTIYYSVCIILYVFLPQIHYGRGILALGSSDKSVSLWLPNRL